MLGQKKMDDFGIVFCFFDQKCRILALSVIYIDNEKAYWTFFGVLKACRKLNFGIKMEEAIIQYCKIKSIKELGGEIRESNKKLIAFHKMFGFEIEGVKGFDADEKKLQIKLRL